MRIYRCITKNRPSPPLYQRSLHLQLKKTRENAVTLFGQRQIVVSHPGGLSLHTARWRRGGAGERQRNFGALEHGKRKAKKSVLHMLMQLKDLGSYLQLSKKLQKKGSSSLSMVEKLRLIHLTKRSTTFSSQEQE